MDQSSNQPFLQSLEQSSDQTDQPSDQPSDQISDQALEKAANRASDNPSGEPLVQSLIDDSVDQYSSENSDQQSNLPSNQSSDQKFDQNKDFDQLYDQPLEPVISTTIFKEFESEKELAVITPVEKYQDPKEILPEIHIESFNQKDYEKEKSIEIKESFLDSFGQETSIESCSDENIGNLAFSPETNERKDNDIKCEITTEILEKGEIEVENSFDAPKEILIEQNEEEFETIKEEPWISPEDKLQIEHSNAENGRKVLDTKKSLDQNEELEFCQNEPIEVKFDRVDFNSLQFSKENLQEEPFKENFVEDFR